MPQIKVERLVSFTSEDPTSTASNILSKDPSKKWKCKTAGEKSASIVLQLDQPYVINAIDIGNENSAYVEILVSRSSAPEDFKVLLVMSSFMSPLEARQTQNVNKVRMFKHELLDPERNEKWDRIKIVCTQPFNRHVQYGLSFINLYSSDAKGAEKVQQQPHIGKFLIRPESPDNLSAGSIFARRRLTQESSESPALKGAAAIREATSLAHSGSPAPKQKIKLNLSATPKAQSSKRRSSSEDDETSTPKGRQERNRNALLYSKDEEDKHDKIDKLIEKKAEETSRKQEKEKQVGKQKDTPSKGDWKRKEQRDQATPSDSKKNNKHRTSPVKDALKRKQNKDLGRDKKKLKKDIIEKPFAKLLEGVVLVISGIQNPDRASLRSMALSMGAKYKPDWDNTCTHLICAFANTPKFNQVKGKGKIIKRKWLEDCYNERKKLPWRRYALDKADQGPESEEEMWEKDDTPDTEILEGYVVDVDSEDDTKAQGSDTDEKIEAIRKKQTNTKPEDDNIFSLDTDSDSAEDNDHKNLEIEHKLKNFFEDKIFYVDESLDEDLQRKLKQYVVAYSGILLDNLEASIDIIVTNSNNYKVLKDIYPTAICVAPDWIWECHNCQKLTPMTDYIYE